MTMDHNSPLHEVWECEICGEVYCTEAEALACEEECRAKTPGQQESAGSFAEATVSQELALNQNNAKHDDNENDSDSSDDMPIFEIESIRPNPIFRATCLVQEQRPTGSSRSSRVRRTLSESPRDETDENEVTLANEQAEPRNSTGSRGRKRKKKRVLGESMIEETNDDDTNEENVMKPYSQELAFSSQTPELSQEIAPVRVSDRNNFMKLSEEVREKALVDVLQLILFKGLAGAPIDRSKIIKEAGIRDARITSAVLEEVNLRLQAIFDFKLFAVPNFMMKFKDLPSKFKDRYYLVNLAKGENGTHSKALHSISEQGAQEKGLLMVVLAFIFCKGESRSDKSRWLLDKDLYMLLHQVDDDIHSEPPSHHKARRPDRSNPETLDVDGLIAKFVYMDYLIAVKGNEQLISVHADATDESLFYCLGPRAAVEIGRRQIVQFCSKILDQEPDPSMLEDIQEDDEKVAAEGEEA